MGAPFFAAKVGPDDLDTCLEIRREVFVRGQEIPEEIEIDGLDGECLHFLAWLGDKAVGAARLRESEGRARAERVAVLERQRGLGVGRVLMAALEAEARSRGHSELVLNAQEDVIPFYERLGYTAHGPSFLEAGIPHRAMRKRLSLAGTAQL
ncbi:MAG: GNAT family N-acetyltransferase [Myxococcota bacterium]